MANYRSLPRAWSVAGPDLDRTRLASVCLILLLAALFNCAILIDPGAPQEGGAGQVMHALGAGL